MPLLTHISQPIKSLSCPDTRLWHRRTSVRLTGIAVAVPPTMHNADIHVEASYQLNSKRVMPSSIVSLARDSLSPSSKSVDDGEGSSQLAIKKRVNSCDLLYSGAWRCPSEGGQEYPTQLDFEEQESTARMSFAVQSTSPDLPAERQIGQGNVTPKASGAKGIHGGAYLSSAEYENFCECAARQKAPPSTASSGRCFAHHLSCVGGRGTMWPACLFRCMLLPAHDPYKWLT